MNKVKLLILAMFLFVQSSTFAVGLDYGMEFGVSQSNFNFPNGEYELENNLGYGVGVSAKLDLPLVDIGPELWYTRNTASFKGADMKLKSNSFDLPLIVTLTILGPLKIEAGPSFSLSSNAKLEYGDSQTYKMGRIKPDVGYVVGAKVVILGVLTVSARYNGSSKQTVDLMGSSFDMRTSSYSVNVGAKF